MGDRGDIVHTREHISFWILFSISEIQVYVIRMHQRFKSQFKHFYLRFIPSFYAFRIEQKENRSK